MIIKNESGEDVEVFTPEEIAQQNEEKDRALAELQKAKEDLEIDKQALEAKMQNYEGKDYNFSNLRKQKEEKEKEAEELKKRIAEVESGMASKLSEIEQGRINDIKNNSIGVFAGDDEKLKEKIDFYYKKFAGEAKTPQEINERVNEAYLLATGGNHNAMRGSIISSAGGSVSYFEGKKQEKLQSPEAIEVAAKMGISQETLKKSGLI